MTKLYVFVLSVILLSPLAFFLTKYVPYYLHQLKDTSQGVPFVLSGNTSVKDSERLGYLEELTSLPVVGQLFLEDKIAELMKLGRFADVIQKSQAAIQSPINARSFSIWYHRALSQCLLKQFEECESSLSQATLYTNPYTENLLQSVYSILNELSNLQKMDKGNTDVKQTHKNVLNIVAGKQKTVPVNSYEEL